MKIDAVEPSLDFAKRLRERLHDEARYLHIRTRFFSLGLLGVLAVVLTPIALTTMVTAAQRSGFVVFASLVVSDTMEMQAQWQDYLFSLLESLPVIEMIATCVIAAVLLACVQYVMNEYSPIWKHFQRLRRVSR